MLSNQNEALSEALEAERNECHTLVESNEGLKERHKTCTDDKIRLAKEIVGLRKNQLDNQAMQCKLDFAKRAHESMSSRCNAAELKVKNADDSHLRNVYDTCKQETQSTNKMGCFRTQSKLREHRNHSIKTDSIGKL